jgi:tetratricopeptide (TPR) repeat protein
MAARPVAAAGLLGKKALLAFSPVELPNTNDVEWQAAQSPLFRAWPWLPFDFTWLLALSIAAAPQLRSMREHAPLAAGVALVGLVTCALFLSSARFRLPIVLPLVVLAAVGARRLVERATWRPGPAALRSVAPALLVLVFLRVDVFGLRRYSIPELETNAGMCARSDGHLDEARARLGRALEARPDDATAWMELVRADEDAGDVAAAAAAFRAGRTAIARDPDVHPAARAFLARHPGCCGF